MQTSPAKALGIERDPPLGAPSAHSSLPGWRAQKWDYFDTGECAERVLEKMKFSPFWTFSVHSPAQIAALGRINHIWQLEVSLAGPADLSPIARRADSLRVLSLRFQEPGVNLTSLPVMQKLERLSVIVPGLADLRFLEVLPVSLKEMKLGECQKIDDYAPLLRFAQLWSLELLGSRGLRDLRELPSLGHLNTLSMDGSGLSQDALHALVGLAPRITRLGLRNCGWLDDLRPLANYGLMSSLEIQGSPALGDLRHLSGYAYLTHLTVSRSSIEDLEPLASLTKLISLRLTDCISIADLRPLANLPDLMHLYIEGTAAVESDWGHVLCSPDKVQHYRW
jgi:hypothetical protein